LVSEETRRESTEGDRDLGRTLQVAPPERPYYANDGDFETADSLGVDEYAESFARLLIAKDYNPPLALGLFGNWGGRKELLHVSSAAAD
jgi:hypothetical protein